MRILVFNVEPWLGTARLPRELRRVGFEVAVLCPVDVFLAATEHVDERYFIPDREPQTIGRCFAETIDKWQPDLIVPGDERVLQFMHKVVEAHVAGRLTGMSKEAAEGVARSLPDHRHFATTQVKNAFMDVASEMGISVPEYREVFTLADALQFAEEFDYPVVLKAGVGCGGEGVRVCDTEDDLVAAAGEMFKSYYGNKSSGARLTVQRFVEGSVSSVAAVAYKGKLLAAAGSRKTICHPANGPSTVRTFEDVPTVIEDCAKFAEATAFTGFFGMDYMLEAQTGRYFLIECNARPTPQMHVAVAAGVDLFEALFAAMNGNPVKRYQVKDGFAVVLYPQEMVRDPGSEWAKTEYHDVPTDDPTLKASYEDYIVNVRSRDV